MKSLIINEIFYSIQGETSRSGLPTYFIRLTGCPLRCTYCDTGYAFNAGSKMSFEEILSKLNRDTTKYITITGGEPLSQKNVQSLMKELCDLNYSVSLETSNAITIEDVDSRVSIILDIKTPGSLESDKNLISNYSILKKSDELKFVICNQKDFEWAVDYIKKNNLSSICPIIFSPSYNQMPLSELADLILKNSLNVRLQTQLHKTIWGEVNGK
ncbi:MAG: 7-carboxy-7-deazaguanine synthase QueE [Gammaproteobacteria bacterium]